MFRRPWALSLGWILLCAVLFFALARAEDPSRRHGRILSIDAGVRALAILSAVDPAKYRGYEVVHVAYAEKNEGGGRARWVVLCDRVPHTAMKEAVVVELDAATGERLGVRRPRMAN